MVNEIYAKLEQNDDYKIPRHLCWKSIAKNYKRNLFLEIFLTFKFVHPIMKNIFDKL